MTETTYIIDILILLIAAVVSVPLFQRLGLGAVLGFLVAGALIGPWGLGFISAVEEIRHLAEFGVIFLLFIIGIELKPSRLWIMRKSVFGLGSAQLLATGAAITLVALYLGLPARSALVVGFGLALSSTAFGLQILSDKGELGTAYGRTSFAILLFQDLAIVPLMALLSFLATQDMSITQDVGLAALESVLIIIGVFIAGRILLRPLFQIIAGSQRNPEIFTAMGILLVLGAAWLAGWAGLSMALGAFLGGLLLADSPYRHQIMADIQPFRGLLLGLFFMSVGMSINFGLFGTQGLLVAGLTSGLLLTKATLVWVLCRLTGRTFTESAHVALLLAQAGEFGFILFGLANLAGLMDSELYQLLLLIIALSMTATPLLVKLSPWLGLVLDSATPSATPLTKPIPASRNHVIVAGFGRFGSFLAHKLAEAQVPHLVLEIDPVRVARAQSLDYPVFYGDASQVEVLRAAGAADARLLVFAMNQMKSIGQAVVTAREAFPLTNIYARAWDTKMAQKLLSMGVTYAIPETLETSLQLTRDVLQAVDVPPKIVEQLVGQVQAGTKYKIRKPKALESRSGYKLILLVLTKQADEQAILNYAVAMASDNRAALTVVEVLTEASTSNEQGISSPDELDERVLENRGRRLEKLVAGLREGVEIQTKVLIGRPSEEISRIVTSDGYDLVLKPAEGGNGLKARIFGDNDSHLLKICPCPVLLIRSIPPSPFRHRRICAGVYQDEKPGGHRDDRYAINRKILEHATELAAAQFAELHIVHAWQAYGEQDLQSGFSPFQSDTENYVDQEQKRNREALNTVLSQLQESRANEMLPAFHPACHMIKGGHRDAIVRFAVDLEADLVVVGTGTRSGLTSLIVDSTAAAITKHLDCSVLVIKLSEIVAPEGVEDL